jgi:hypothetical protein
MIGRITGLASERYIARRYRSVTEIAASCSAGIASRPVS